MTSPELAALLDDAVRAPSRLLWLDAGSPAHPRATNRAALCCLCAAESARAAPRKDVFGPGFTDYDKLSAPGAQHVCEACIWALGGKPPDTLRLWSIVYRADRRGAPSNAKAIYPHGAHTHLTSKSDVAEIVDVLLSPPDAPWVCCVAESGQIHLLPFARVNHGSELWTVRYEREDVSSSSLTFARVLYHGSALLAAGFIREDIETLEPHPSKLVKHGVAVWREHAGPLKQWRRSALLALAVALTRKDTYGQLRDRCAAILGEERRGPVGPCTRAGARDDGERDDGADRPDGLVAAGEVVDPGGGGESADVGRRRADDGREARDRHALEGERQGRLL